MNTPRLAILFWAMDRWIGAGFVSLRCGEKVAGGLTGYAAAKAVGRDGFVKGTIAIGLMAIIGAH